VALRELGLHMAQGLPAKEALAQARQTLRVALARGDVARQERALLAALRVERSREGALILAANVVLPFAVAQADLERALAIAAKARELYVTLPGLPSNAITRTMRAQLGLARLPAQARAHQGLHHIWAMHCREKRANGAHAPLTAHGGQECAPPDTLCADGGGRALLDHLYRG
jgi:hypothetical protein